jgi:hypothetical protein
VALLGSNIPLLEPRPIFKSICVLCRHFKRALQHLPCPQSTQYGWQGLVMSRAMYGLLTVNAFCLPNNPGPAADYTPADPNDRTPLTRTEQASVDAAFVCECHYFLTYQNIKRACFNALDGSINNAFKVSNDPAFHGWHMGMSTRKILDQLSTSYGQPTPAMMELTNATFCGPYSAANAPKVLFCRIKNCAEIAIMDNNPYTDCQLTTNAVCLLLTTGLDQRAFEEWDRLTAMQQMWIALWTLIQEAFQRHLNATAPTAGHHGYAPAQPYHQNVFGILGNNKSNDEESIAKTVTTQVAALTYQSQPMQLMAANTSQRQDMQMAQLAANQDVQHATMHQLINEMNAMAFNMSDAGCSHFAGHGYGSRGHGGHSRMQGCGCGPPAYIGGYPQGGGIPQGGFPPTMGCPMGASHGPPVGFSGTTAGGIPPYCAPVAPVINGG